MTLPNNTASNAFNFLSFVNNSVDPRTGQYTLAIELPELVANNLSGPSLPLRVGFNPMNVGDSGFGSGWTLNLTQYTPANNLLHLHTGESFKVTAGDAGDGTGLALRERKLASFHLYQHGDGWRVVHKAGMIELLELQGPSDNRVALPTRVLAPTGHGITLSYANFQGAPCLTGIVDDTGLSLLAIRYTSSLVTIDLHPVSGPGGTPLASYQIQLDSRFSPPQRLPHTIVLPGPDQASWRLAYQQVRGVVCLSEVSTPVGGVERIAYNDEGHRFPSDAYDPLPRVTRHTIVPGFDQPDMVTTYSYTSNNFLGFGSGITWRDDGEDNLYKNTDSRFSYGSTASYLADGQPLRSITRTFNRFHLLTLQRTEQAHEVFDEGSDQPRRETCVEETQTTYHELPNLTFEQQPAYFQLPRVQSQRWSVLEDLARRREEVVITHYDEHGNLTLESQAAPPVYQGEALDEARTLAGALRTQYSYYPREGEGDDCPADPDAFVRHRKTATQLPAETSEGQADPLRTRYRYRHLPALSAAPQSNGVLMAHEEDVLQLHGEQEQLLQSTLISYLTESSHNALLHGRVNVQQLILRDPTDPSRDKSASSTFFYSKVEDTDGQPLLQVRETFKGHDLAERMVTRASSIHSGRVLRDQDENLVDVHYRYDALQRLTRETVAPGTPFESTRHYAYTLGRDASETVTNVNGVATRTWFDGYNRALWQERETLDEKTGQRAWHKVEATRYDDVGRVAEQTTYDYLDEQTLGLTSTFGYDAWGERTTALQPDGVVVCHQRSPFGREGYIVQDWQERADEPRPRQRRQFTRSEFNRFDKPVRDERLASDGQLVGSTAYAYDGYGRSVRQVQQLRDPLNLRAAPIEQVTRFAYDAWSRMVSTQRPDGTTLVRRFASHSSNDLTTELELLPAGSQTGSLICKRSFDGLERLTSLTVGNRTETYRYQGQRVLVHERDKASGRTLSYAYTPELTSAPDAISVKGALAADGQATFAYARHDASITSAQNGTGKRDYAYTDQGYLARESWAGVQPAEDFAIDHLASLQGRPLERSSSDGLITAHSYDSEGRLHTTTQGSLSARFSYDADGRLWQTVTQDSASQRQATCTVEYDSLGRETARTTELDDGSSSGTQLTWRDDDLLHSRRVLRDGQVRLLETFAYDALNRLERADYEADDPQDLPRNRAGRGITSQVLRFDERDNLTRCQTRFGDGTVDDGRFSYGAASKADVHDQFQLREATHTLQPDYPATQAFSYDADGNQLNDEWGRQLRYDVMGRLEQVVSQQDGEPLVRYRYDGHDHLLGVHWQGQSHEQLRRYEGYRLSAVRQGDQLTQLLHGSDQPLGQQRHDQASDTLLLLTDSAGSVTGEYGAEGVQQAHYSLYGERGDDDALRSLLGFNGEVREQQLDWYLLGRGYRAYNPGLMRFHSPDSLAPEVSGINPYLYALGNPVNWRDPTGHRASPTPSRDPKPPYIDPVEEPKQLGGFMAFLPFILGTVGMILGGIVAFLAPPILAVGIGVLAAAAGAGVVAAVAPAIEDPNTRFIVEQLGWGLIGFGSSAALGGMFAKFQGKVPWTQSPRAFGRAAAPAASGNVATAQRSSMPDVLMSEKFKIPRPTLINATGPTTSGSPVDVAAPAPPPPPPPPPASTAPVTVAPAEVATQPNRGQQRGPGMLADQLLSVTLRQVTLSDRAPSSGGSQLYGSQQGALTGKVRQVVVQ